MTDDDIAARIGAILKQSPVLHNGEKDLAGLGIFNLHSITLFQRLVSAKTLEQKVMIKSDRYYKSLVFIEYYCGVISDSYSVCAYMNKTSENLKNPELSLGAIVGLAGLQAAGKDKYDQEQIRQRYDLTGSQVSCFDADPYYRAIGRMVAGFIEYAKPYLSGVSSRPELYALVFTDSCMEFLAGKPEYADVISKQLGAKDYFGASMTALEGIGKIATQDLVLKQLFGDNP